MRKAKRHGRVRDWLAYVAIAVVFYGTVLGWAYYQFKTGGSADLPLKWLFLAGLTAIIFGYTIKWFRRSWGRRFWLLLALTLSVHLCGWTVVLLRMDRVSLQLMGMVAGAEHVCLLMAMDWLLTGKPPWKPI